MSKNPMEIKYNNKISSLSLDNFKGFQKKTTLEFSPGINLIYGKNSAGKSSIIQSLRLHKQSYHMSGTPAHFRLAVPSHVRIPGSLTFPEGYPGIINKKNLKKDLILGLGTFGRPFTSKKKEPFRSEMFLEYVYNNKNNQMYPDIKQINISEKEVFEKSNKPKKEITFLKLFFNKKQIFKNNKLSQLLTKAYKVRRSRLEGFNVEGYLKTYKDKSVDIISKEDLSFQYLDIKKSEFNFGEYKTAHQEIMKDLIKFRKIINKNIDYGLAGAKGIKGKELDKFLSTTKKTGKKVKNKPDTDLFINAGEFSYIGRKELKSLKKFVNSENFKDEDKFKDFLIKDFKNKIKLIKHRDIFFDITLIELNVKATEETMKAGALPPPLYFIYCHDLIMESLNESSRFDVSVPHIYSMASDDVQYTTRQITVVPGLRQLPQRYMKRGLEEKFIGEQAENMGDILNKKDIKNKVNEWFDKFEIPYHVDTKLVGNFFEIIMKPTNDKTYNLTYRDVGLGYSLSLPLIITAITSKNSIILCEEPELHLHPKMQASLMELFMFSALVNNNQFIVETHSENLLLRAQKIMRKGININKIKTPIKSNYINIFNISSSPEKGSEAQKIILDSKGEFKTHWKDGFFAERLDELF